MSCVVPATSNLNLRVVSSCPKLTNEQIVDPGLYILSDCCKRGFASKVKRLCSIIIKSLFFTILKLPQSFIFED